MYLGGMEVDEIAEVERVTVASIRTSLYGIALRPFWMAYQLVRETDPDGSAWEAISARLGRRSWINCAAVSVGLGASWRRCPTCDGTGLVQS